MTLLIQIANFLRDAIANVSSVPLRDIGWDAVYPTARFRLLTITREHIEFLHRPDYFFIIITVAPSGIHQHSTELGRGRSKREEWANRIYNRAKFAGRRRPFLTFGIEGSFAIAFWKDPPRPSIFRILIPQKAVEFLSAREKILRRSCFSLELVLKRYISLPHLPMVNAECILRG